jgi:gliding motility-associated-like protein
LLSNASILTVNTSGNYTIRLTKTDGTGCFRSKDVFVDASELATVTLDDITVVDISDVNSISVNTTNLGSGDYEFGLDNESYFQDEPFFNNVAPGFHMLYIRDKDGCGTTELEIAVIGYPKYFTPNGDSFNETWLLKGLELNDRYLTTVYIFNRYGKLIKQLNASIGWDGTINGAKLPTNDYWFRAILKDGREFSGHFTLKR